MRGAIALPALRDPAVSIVICNFNYGRFLEEALRSALEQTYPCQVIAVDDGSTDESRAVLEGWAGRVQVLLQANMGQLAAYNTGFANASGDIVIFLDSDDTLDADAVKRAARGFKEGVVKVHYRLRLVDEAGRRLGTEVPHLLTSGNVAAPFLEKGVLYASAPGSGNAYRRAALARLFPLPVDTADRHGADFFTNYGVVLFGEVRGLANAAGSYRVHSGRTTQSADLMFGNTARDHDELRRMQQRAVTFRAWIAERTGGLIALPPNFYDFSLEKVVFARAVFEADSYWAGCQQGYAALATLLRSLWLRPDYSNATKAGLSTWAVLVLAAPRRLGFPLARFVCNPASRRRLPWQRRAGRASA